MSFSSLLIHTVTISNPPLPFNASTAYSVGDHVTHAGTTWRCIIANSTPPPNETYWVEAVDRYGNELENVYDAGTASPARVEPLSQEALSQEEQLADRDTRLTRYRVFLPPEAAISALSRVTWEGFTYRVDGEPEPHHNAIGLHHKTAVLEGVEG